MKIGLIICGILILLLTSKLGGWKRITLWVIAVILVFSQGYLLLQEVRTHHIKAKSGKIESPYSPGTNLSIYYGSNLFVTSAKVLNDDILSHFIFPWPKMNASIRRKNDKLLVDIDIKNKNGAIVAKLINNEWVISDEALDRNYDDEHFEVFDKYEDVPVLQIMLLENVVVLNGVFYTKEGQKHVATAEGLFINPQEPLKKLISPWFEYPSAEYPGKLRKESILRTIRALRESQKRIPK